MHKRKDTDTDDKTKKKIFFFNPTKFFGTKTKIS